MSDRLLTDAQIVACIVEAGCLGTAKLTYDSGPYEITLPTAGANRLAGAIERALAQQADADLTRLRAECERLRVALTIVREYPDFDNGGPLPEMMDQVLRGEPAPMLDSLDRLTGAAT